MSAATFFAMALCMGAVVSTGTWPPAASGAVWGAIWRILRPYTPLRVAGGAGSGESIVPNGSPSPSVIHPDDRSAVAHAAAYAFWTGVPQVMSYRHRQPDGSYRRAELRAEPGYGVSVDVDAMVSGPDDRWTASDALDETAEVVRAAKVIESLHGKAWAFDAEGKFIYVTPAAQSAIGMSVDDLNAPVRGGAFVDGGDVGWSRGVHPDDYADAAAKLRHCLRTGNYWNVEYRMLRATGQYVWHRISARPAYDDQGKISGWYGTSIDIDVYKRTEAALRASERALSQLIDLVPSHIWRLTSDGQPVFFNKRMVDFLGVDVAGAREPGASRLEALMEFVHPDDATVFKDAFDRCRVSGDSFSTRYRLRRADGAYRWMSSRAEPIRDNGGRIVQWYGICHDIDDQMHTEEALRRSERRLQQLIDAVPALIWSTTQEGRPTYVNKRFTEVTGATLEDITASDGSPSLSVIHPDDRRVAMEAVVSAFETGRPYVMRYRQLRRGGAYRWTETRAEALRDESGAVCQWYGVSVDIDDLVSAQQALRERERELSHLVDMVPSMLWRLDPDGEPVFFSKRMVDYFGLDVGECGTPPVGRLAAAVSALAHPDDAARLREALERSLAHGESFELNYRLRRADGVYRWMSGRAEPMRDESGRIVQWYGLSHDIDDQVRGEEALRERERGLRQLVETLPAMIDCAAPDGEPIYRSRQLREFLGYGLEDLKEAGKSGLTATLESGVHPDDLAVVRKKYAQSLSTGEPYARRHRLRRFDGEYRWVETRAAAMRDVEGAIVQWNVICLDIDGEVRAQEELGLARERMARAGHAASLAELSASIAHEVNQPLAAIVANSNACQRWLTAEPANLERALKTVERIIRDANSAADVVSRIRALFKHSSEARGAASIATVIAEARDFMAEEAIRRGIRFDVAFDNDLPVLVLDRVQVQQVLINLVRNGMDAMGSTPGAKVLGLRAYRLEDLVRIEVSDRGPGVEFPEKIFEPFFTTKKDGMGMGLAICRSIVEAHGGRLWIEENEPRGARFIFTLPVERTASP
ncbi:PAS domain-containing protein [Xanthobacteraceae bacterium Astr-EGSB]|uniref:PAS domain-containing protein n=1 Tax=Astrobacterium formosum TaxID=3069710 RepID=UPI0027B86A46|nr:PAS domain-containing protein [Xanthobacteraceae bacterium Astr-EGSB]